MNKKIRKPNLIEAFSLCTIILLSLVVGSVLLNLDIVINLLFLLLVTCLLCIRMGHSIDNIVEYISDSIKHSTGVFLIFILIALIIGVWVLSGTVPALIYYGLTFISGEYFLIMAFLICSIVAFATGTSWGTAATIGVAFMGIGKGMNIPDAITAGTIISGVYFGDKMSPLASTTILCSMSAGVKPQDHLKSMNVTGFLTFFITSILYLFLGFFVITDTVIPKEEILEINGYLQSTFDISPIILLPIVTTLLLSFMKITPYISMTVGILIGIIQAAYFQHANISEIFEVLSNGYRLDNGPDNISSMLNQGGLQPMMWTFSLSFVGFSLGGVLDRSGILKVLLSTIIGKVKGYKSLSFVTFMTGWLGCAVTSEVYVAQMLNGRLYQDVYIENGLCKSMLSRFIEESTTVFDMFIPWTTGGAFMATVLGVYNFNFMPYSFFCILTPIISLMFTSLGLGIISHDQHEKNRQINAI